MPQNSIIRSVEFYQLVYISESNEEEEEQEEESRDKCIITQEERGTISKTEVGCMTASSLILAELAESERVFEGLLASLSDISCTESSEHETGDSGRDLTDSGRDLTDSARDLTDSGRDSGGAASSERDSGRRGTSSEQGSYPGMSSSSSLSKERLYPPSKIQYDYKAENTFEEIRSFNPSSETESSNSNNVSEPEGLDDPSNHLNNGLQRPSNGLQRPSNGLLPSVTRVIQSTDPSHSVGSYSPSNYETLARGHPESGMVPRCNPYDTPVSSRSTPISRSTPTYKNISATSSRSTPTRPSSRGTTVHAPMSPYTQARAHLDALEHQLSNSRERGMNSRTTSSSSVLDEESNAYFENGLVTKTLVNPSGGPKTSTPLYQAPKMSRVTEPGLKRSYSAPNHGPKCLKCPQNQVHFPFADFKRYTF